jgi:hypothetical protein
MRNFRSLKEVSSPWYFLSMHVRLSLNVLIHEFGQELCRRKIEVKLFINVLRNPLPT